MSRAAHIASTISTPIAPAPEMTGPVRDDFTVRISQRVAVNGTLERDPEGQWIGRLRRISAAKLRLWGLAALMDDAKLLISELVTNALQHSDGEIEFRLVVTLRGLLISVNDGSAHRPQLCVVGADSESGRGLFLVAALADGWGVSPDGTTTWCTLATPKER
jgi:anti-sigma regulatory factor (Ser/Thr protein kinase)